MRVNIPNIITVFRILLVPLFLFVFHSNLENRVLYSGLIFMLAGLSDILDGQIARRYNLTTKLGAVLDPFADKMMSFAVLISFTMSDFIPIWILIPLVIKEVVMILGGGLLYLRHEKSVIPSNIIGKVGTLLFYAAISTIVFKAPKDISTFLLVVTVLINLMAFYNYFRIFLSLKRDNTITVDKYQ